MAKAIIGLKGIDSAIKRINGVLGSINTQVQDIAVAIVEHGAGDGNGDMSRALTLCQTVKRHRTLNVAFLVGWFRYFGNCTVDLNANDGKGKVSLRSKDSKGYRGFDVAGAKVNNWFDAFDDKGNRSNWYAGPQPAEYQPETVGDIAARMQRFVKNTTKLMTETKTVNGKEVAQVQLTDSDKSQVEHALAFIDRIAATLARHEDVAKLEAAAAKAKAEATVDEAVLDVLGIEQDNDEQQDEQAVA